MSDKVGTATIMKLIFNLFVIGRRDVAFGVPDFGRVVIEKTVVGTELRRETWRHFFLLSFNINYLPNDDVIMRSNGYCRR